MTDDPQGKAALAEAWHRYLAAITPSAFSAESLLDDAGGILAALRGWTLVPNGEIEQLRAAHIGVDMGRPGSDHSIEVAVMPRAEFDRLRAVEEVKATEIASAAADVAARVLHRYRHPTFAFSTYRCHCLADAVSVAVEPAARNIAPALNPEQEAGR
jgi:hypothetical protein